MYCKLAVPTIGDHRDRNICYKLIKNSGFQWGDTGKHSWFCVGRKVHVQ